MLRGVFRALSFDHHATTTTTNQPKVSSSSSSSTYQRSRSYDNNQNNNDTHSNNTTGRSVSSTNLIPTNESSSTTTTTNKHHRTTRRMKRNDSFDITDDVTINDTTTTNNDKNYGNSNSSNNLDFNAYRGFLSSSTSSFDNNNNKNHTRLCHSSPELNYDFHNQSTTSINSDFDYINAVAQQLGTSIPHSIDYYSSESQQHQQQQNRHHNRTGTALSSHERREQRLREREQQRQKDQQHTIDSSTRRHNSERMKKSSSSNIQSPTNTPNHHHTYQPSIQCNPVCPLVLDNLPMIQVRYEDLFPDDDDITQESDEYNHGLCGEKNCTSRHNASSSSSISIGLNHLIYSCTICSDEIEIQSNVVRLPCSHIYHHQCIHTWFLRFNTCPICRYTLPTINDFTSTTSMKKHFQSTKNDNFMICPIQYTPNEVQTLSMQQLQDLYTSWVICTYNHCNNTTGKLSMQIPAHITDPSTLIQYMVSCNIIRINRPMKQCTTTNVTSTSYEKNDSHHHTVSDLQSMSIYELKQLLPKSIDTSSTHYRATILEKHDLIQLVLQQTSSSSTTRGTATTTN